MGKKASRKYGNKKVTVDGIVFDSLLEARRYGDLKLMLSAGEIRDLVLQPKYWLKCGGKDVRIRSESCPNGRRSSWRGDFAYWDVKRERAVVEDVKGHDVYRSRLKRAMVEAEYGITIEIVR